MNDKLCRKCLENFLVEKNSWDFIIDSTYLNRKLKCNRFNK